MRQGPKSVRVDSNNPQIEVPPGLPLDARIRRPLVNSIVGIAQIATVFAMVTLAGACFAFGVALATRWLQ